MKTLQIRNGDLFVAPGGYGMLTGAAKVRQDLACAILEGLGEDRFHPRWGSTLPNMVGTPYMITTHTVMQSEVRRIVNNYMATQSQALQRDRIEGRQSRYSAQEIITKILDIKIGFRADRVTIRVLLQSLAGEQMSVATFIGSA
jgi:hypothetical protein